jgi:acyl carrier protein
MRDEIVSAFRNAAAEITGRDLPLVDDATPFDEMGMDSVDAVEILTRIEDALGVHFRDEHLSRLRTLGDVVALVTELRGATP